MISSDPFLRPFTGAPTILAIDTKPRPPKRTADGRTIGSAIMPSAGVRAKYDSSLKHLIDEMHNSVLYWLSATWKKQIDRIGALGMAADMRYIAIDSASDPTDGTTRIIQPSDPDSLNRVWASTDALSIASDARPSTELQEVVRRLRRRWLSRFDEASGDLAHYFARATWQRSDVELRRILKRIGITVEFKISQTIRDALAAIVQENVALIRSIPEQYLTQVESSVMRSVVAGRDLASVTADLQHQHGVVRRRAEFISLDQNNKSTGAIQRLQYLELGIEKAIWRHSTAGKEPRPSHVANDGHEYAVATGWFDPHERQYVIPGQLPRCRCFSQPILSR